MEERPKKLLDQVHDTIRLKHCSIRTKNLSEKGVGQPFQAVQAGWKACPTVFRIGTKETCVDWVRHFILFPTKWARPMPGHPAPHRHPHLLPTASCSPPPPGHAGENVALLAIPTAPLQTQPPLQKLQTWDLRLET